MDLNNSNKDTKNAAYHNGAHVLGLKQEPVKIKEQRCYSLQTYSDETGVGDTRVHMFLSCDEADDPSE